MSSEALSWAIRCRLESAPLKNLTMIVADLANHVSGEVYGSLDYYQEVTGLSKRTVLKCLGELIELGILEETDERKGKTGQIPVYLFHMAEGIPQVTKWAPKRSGAKTHPLENGPAKGVQKGSETGALLQGKGVQKRTTEPRRGNQEEEPNPPSPIGEDTPTGESDLFGEMRGRSARYIVWDEVDAFRPLWQIVEEEWRSMCVRYGGISDIGVMNPSRRKMIETRANEVVKDRARRNIVSTPEQVWQEIFAAIGRSTFLLGRAPPGKGRTGPFRLGLDYVLRQREFSKILEGGYDDDPRYKNKSFDASTGREFSPAEAATRAAIGRIRSAGARRDGRGNPGGDDARADSGSAGSLVRLPR